MLTLAGRSRGRSRARGRGRGRGRGRARVCGSLLAPAPWELTFGAVAEQGGCEPEAASPPVAFRGAQLRGRPRPQRGAALLPYPPNPGGPGPEAGAPGDVTARAGSAFGASGRLASRVSPAAAAAAAAAATRERNVVASKRDEMWSEGRYDYERLPRERVPPRSHPSDESGYRWARDDHSTSRQPDYRDMRDGFRRKSFYSSHYSRDRSPHKRDAPFFRESPVGRKDSPHSRSGSSVSSRSYSPERSRTHSSHQSQHRSKERAIQSLKTSRDTSPSSSSAVSSSKVLDKPSRLTEKELAEAESKWASETLEKSDGNNLAEISEFEAGSTAPLFIDQMEEPESNTADGPEMYEDSQISSRSKAIASKTKEIEQVYRQDCETFGMVVKMLIEKDPSLERSIQFALRQNLHEIGERCVEELKHFITEYDNSTQDFGDSF
ncbi:periphilin-1 isoform X5 [Mastomys coucha]|uniref:periphilin-1 isoform X5 n=1 Tax=Mastomys coucha TaxID=35658 RepID=UPI001262288A|nr:periphilin-1 isoform X5 [Mastomys coucha]